MYKYEHGGNEIFKNKNIIDFSANINPLGLKKGSIEILKKSIKKSIYYPDNFSTNLRQAISKFENIDKENIFCSNGASDIIFRFVNFLKPKKALILAPTFSDYERALKTNNCYIHRHLLLEENEFNLDESILDIIKKEKFDIIFLCNPNNPTGQLIKNDLVQKILENKETYVFVDECFIDFIKDNDKYSSKKFIPNNKNLIILKAFTKIFAMAGFRLGYCLTSNQNIIENLYLYGADWSVSNIAQDIGIYSLENSEDYIEKTINYISIEKQKIKDVLLSLNFKIIGSNANYIFFKGFKNFDKILYNNYNIFIRNCDNYFNLSNEFFRIGIYNKAQNQKLINAIKEIKINLEKEKKYEIR